MSSGCAASASISWYVLAGGVPYHELGADYFARRLDPGRETHRLVLRAPVPGDKRGAFI